jgi:hypothetical protein
MNGYPPAHLINRAFSFGFILILILGITSCRYSFTGISIPQDVRTFYVAPYQLQTPNADPNLSQTFSDALRDKILRESRLNLTDTDPDCEFIGLITRYSISPVAPEPGEVTAFNRLDVTVNMEFINSKDEEQSFKKNFSYFAEFGTSQDFLSIQDDLVETVNEQLVEDIFNAAFTNW